MSPAVIPKARANAALAKLREVLDRYGDLAYESNRLAHVGNRELIKLQVDKVRLAIGACNAAHTEAKQVRLGDFSLAVSVGDLIEALRASKVLLVSASDRADEPEARGMLREVAILVAERLGEEQRKAMWKQASQALQDREAATVHRRMEAGNAITLGSTGSPRRRLA